MVRALIFSCVVVPFYVGGQTLENVKTTFDGDRLVISYDLNNPDPDQKYNITFYSSHDNYDKPLTLTGDAGENISPGKGKKAVWEVRNFLPADFDADITVKVKGAAIVQTLSLISLAKSAYKKGETLELRWKGGKPTDPIKIELYKGSELHQKVTEQSNTTKSYQWQVPKTLKGKGYSLHISNVSTQAFSTAFNIRPKVPLLLKIVPGVLVAGAVVILGGSKSSEAATAPELPGPVKP